MTQDEQARKARTAKATEAWKIAARERRVQRLVAALEDEGYVVTLSVKR